MKILMTGPSSFTGCHIARALSSAGHQITGLLTRAEQTYQGGMESRRLKFSGIQNFVFEAPFGSEQMLKAIDTFRPEYFINHGAPIQGYRSPDFNFLESTKLSLMRVQEVMAQLRRVGCLGVIHSGTVFEADSSLVAMSPYGLSKGFVSETLRFYCSQLGLAYKTILIPNPIGPLENQDRLIPIFISKWKKGEPVLLTQPEQVNDNIPANWLGEFYVEEIKKPFQNSRRKPSGLVLSNLDLCLELKRYFELIFKTKVELKTQPGQPKAPRLGDECSVHLADQTSREDFWVSLLDSYRDLPRT